MTEIEAALRAERAALMARCERAEEWGRFQYQLHWHEVKRRADSEERAERAETALLKARHTILAGGDALLGINAALADVPP